MLPKNGQCGSLPLPPRHPLPVPASPEDMMLTYLNRSCFKWIVVFGLLTILCTSALGDEDLLSKVVNVPLRKMVPSLASHYQSPQKASRMYRDDPIGGGANVLGTYYIEVEANGHRLRLQLVRPSPPPHPAVVIGHYSCGKGLFHSI